MAASGKYQTLYCFTGWGMNSKKMYRVLGTGKVPSAKDCQSLYPITSIYNVDKLKAANNK